MPSASSSSAKCLTPPTTPTISASRGLSSASSRRSREPTASPRGKSSRARISSTIATPAPRESSEPSTPGPRRQYREGRDEVAGVDPAALRSPGPRTACRSAGRRRRSPGGRSFRREAGPKRRPRPRRREARAVLRPLSEEPARALGVGIRRLSEREAEGEDASGEKPGSTEVRRAKLLDRRAAPRAASAREPPAPERTSAAPRRSVRQVPPLSEGSGGRRPRGDHRGPRPQRSAQTAARIVAKRRTVPSTAAVPARGKVDGAKASSSGIASRATTRATSEPAAAISTASPRKGVARRRGGAPSAFRMATSGGGRGARTRKSAARLAQATSRRRATAAERTKRSRRKPADDAPRSERTDPRRSELRVFAPGRGRAVAT